MDLRISTSAVQVGGSATDPAQTVDQNVVQAPVVPEPVIPTVTEPVLNTQASSLDPVVSSPVKAAKPSSMIQNPLAVTMDEKLEQSSVAQSPDNSKMIQIPLAEDVENNSVLEQDLVVNTEVQTAKQNILSDVSSNRHAIEKKPKNKTSKIELGNLESVVAGQESLLNNGRKVTEALAATTNLEEEGNIQIELLRTNVYYTKKLCEEVKSLKRMFQLGFYMKTVMSFLIILTTLFSFYYGYKMFSELKNGGISSIIQNSLPSFDLGDLGGNFFGKTSTPVLETSKTESTVEASDLLSGLGAISKNIDITKLGEIQNVVSEFLK
jgi:hypothetical protein